MTDAPANRLFFALVPDAGVRGRITAAADFLCSRHELGGRRIRPERYHLTLFFLGDAVTAETEALARRTAGQIQAPPFTLQLDQAGSFNNRDIPVWFGCSEPPAELRHLDKLLRRALNPLTEERLRFSPHLTLLREAKARLAKEAVAPIEWPVSEFVLIRSVLGPQSRYEVLQRYPLRGRPLAPEPVQAALF